MTLPQKKILCVDDDEDDLEMLHKAIDAIRPGHNIVEAADGIDALAALEKMKKENELPCLIVLDINMPRLDGKQTLIAIQKDAVLATIPLVIFSTSSSYLDRSFCTSKSVELITKPLDFKSLYTIAGKMLSYCTCNDL